ncbi:MAG: hypothetical protein QW358_05200 [Candidatus Hadarchaeum sp.]
MKGIQIAAVTAVITVVAIAAAIFLTTTNVPAETTSTSQTAVETGSPTTTPEPASDDFTTIEEMLIDLENFGLDNLDSDFGIGAIAGSWD